MRYLSDVRVEVAKQNPDISHLEVNKIIGQQWATVDETVKVRIT